MHQSPPHLENALVELLAALFPEPDALRMVHRYDYREVVYTTSFSGAILLDAGRLVDQLMRAGVVQTPPGGDTNQTRAYFEFLLGERPLARARIVAIATQWGVHDLGRGPATGANSQDVPRRGLHGAGLTKFAQWMAEALPMLTMTQLVQTYLGRDVEARVTARAVSPLALACAILTELKRSPERGDLLVAALVRDSPERRAEVEALYGPIADVDLGAETDLVPAHTHEAVAIAVEGGAPAGKATADHLRHAQHDLYRFLDDLDIDSVDRLDRFNDDERHVLTHKLLDRIICRGVPEEQLLHAMHVNLRFAATDLVEGIDLSRLDTMQRKTAIYGDHSLAVIPEVTLMRIPGAPERPSMAIDRRLLGVLLHHRPLIESGKMSVVPKKVSEMSDRPREVFSVDRIDAVEVDVHRTDFRNVYMHEGRSHDRVGVITFDLPRAGATHLQDVLEIEEVFRAEYETFQHRLRTLLESVHPEDSAQRLYSALREAEAGIQALDARFLRYMRTRTDLSPAAASSGRLVVQIYSDSADAARLLHDAMGKHSRSVKFFGVDEVFALDLQSDPYFVPWLISQVSRKSHA